MLRIKLLSLLSFVILSSSVFAQSEESEIKKENLKQYDIITSQMDIIPGLWRPMFRSEQVAWISPSWESQEYVWFDFPEAIYIDGEFLYMGHLSKRFTTPYPNEKSAPWTTIENGIAYEQVLPNGVSFGGEIVKVEENIASLKINLTNGSSEKLKKVMLLTCVYLDGVKEFSEKTNDNKFVHTPSKGWVNINEALEMETLKDGYNVGWLNEAVLVSDMPVVIVKSKVEGHWFALTWFDDTRSFIGNQNHPCVHADPIYDDLKPGESQTINGELIFFEGTLDEFDVMFKERMKKNSEK